MDTELLKGYGIDYEKGLTNCMGNSAFYKKMLTMFLQDKCFALGRDAYEAGNQKELFSRIHEIKGTSGNLALTALYNASVPLAERLRSAEEIDSEAKKLFSAAEQAYILACEGIKIILASE